jgi:hypothetical protein
MPSSTPTTPTTPTPNPTPTPTPSPTPTPNPTPNPSPTPSPTPSPNPTPSPSPSPIASSGSSEEEEELNPDEYWANNKELPHYFQDLRNSADWFHELPAVKVLTEGEGPVIEIFKGILDVKDAVTKTVLQLALALPETIYGVNLARNSRQFQSNLAGRGNALLSNSTNNRLTQSIYENAIEAHNETLNLPYLSVEFNNVQDKLEEIEKFDAGKALEETKQRALEYLQLQRDRLHNKIKELQGDKEQRNQLKITRIQFQRAELALKRTRDNIMPKIYASSHLQYDINSSLNWQLNSTSQSKYDISSIAINRNIYGMAGAIVPIVVGGAATLAGAGAVIGSIAGWLLSNIFLKTLSTFPIQLLDALKHTVTALVLKVLGSSGSNAYRFLAASILKAHHKTVILGRAGSLLASWAFLVSFSPILIAVGSIIVLAMRRRQKLMLGHNLLVIGETSDVMRSISTVHLYDTNREEMRTELQESAKRLIAASQFGFRKMFGVAFTDDNEPVMVLNLYPNPNIPVEVKGDIAIALLIGGTFDMVLEGLEPPY